MRESPYCDDDEACTNNCCASAPRPLIPIYFMSFTVVAQFILLNIVVAVLMAQLEEESSAYERPNEGLQLGKTQPPTPDVSAKASTESSAAVSPTQMTTGDEDETMSKLDLNEGQAAVKEGSDAAGVQPTTPSMGSDPKVDS